MDEGVSDVGRMDTWVDGEQMNVRCVRLEGGWSNG